jgi:hypothetical protein
MRIPKVSTRVEITAGRTGIISESPELAHSYNPENSMGSETPYETGD